MQNKPTTKDILGAIAVFAEDIQEQLVGVRSDNSSLKSDVSSLNAMVGNIENQMVSKHGFNDRLSNFESKMTELVTQNSEQILMISEKLYDKKVFDKDDIEDIHNLDSYQAMKLKRKRKRFYL